MQFPPRSKIPPVQHTTEKAAGLYPSVSSTVCCPRSMLILSVALESQAGHCHRGFVVSSWRLAFPGSSQAPPAPSCCPRSSSKSSQTPQSLPRLFPLRPFPHQQETKLWPSFRYSSLRRQNSNLPPPRSLGWLRGRTQRRTFTDTMSSLTKVARVGARWGTSNPRVCSRICPAQNTAKSSIQSPDDVSVFTPRCKEMMKLLLPSGEWGWAPTTAAQWQAATAQPCAYCPVSGQWHRLF